MAVNFQKLSASLQAHSYSITAEQQALVEKKFHDLSPAGDIFSIFEGGIKGAIAFLQNLAKLFGQNIPLTEKITRALDTGERHASISQIDRTMHLLRNELLEEGFDPRTAAAITGDISTGVPEMPDSLRAQWRGLPIIPSANPAPTENPNTENSNAVTVEVPTGSTRFATVDTNTITPPIGPNPTPALTGIAPTA